MNRETQTIMASSITKSISFGLLILVPWVSMAQDETSKETRRLQDASEILTEIMNIPETRVPPALLREAHAVAVIPRVVKAGLAFGGRFGKGAISVRRPDNTWSDPAFVKVAGGSWGLQIGISETDVILVFKSKRGVEGITSGKMTLGADASVAAGPVGRNASAATDIKFKAEVYSYSRSRGLFAGIAIEGAVISIDNKANAAFYDRDYVSAGEILYGDIPPPEAARAFMSTLAEYAPDLRDGPSMASDSDATEPAQSDAADSGGEVRTYAIGENAASEELAETGDD